MTNNINIPVNWHEAKWLQDESIKIVGWVAIGEFLKNVDAGWPTSDHLSNIEFFKSNKQRIKNNFNDDFVEIE